MKTATTWGTTLCLILLCLGGLPSLCHAAKRDIPMIDLCQEQEEYRLQAGPNNPWYTFIRHNGAVFRVENGKEIFMAEVSDNCPELSLEDVNFDGIPEVVLQMHTASAGTFYAILSLAGENIGNTLLSEAGGWIISPSIDATKRTITLYPREYGRSNQDVYLFRKGTYHLQESSWLWYPSSMKLWVTRTFTKGKQTAVVIEGEGEDVGDIKPDIELLFLDNTPMQAALQPKAKTTHTVPKGTLARILDVQYHDDGIWLRVATTPPKYTGWVRDGKGLLIREKDNFP